ncbi:MAG: SHOCT domain-containing protein [Chloroflexota bacterium]
MTALAAMLADTGWSNHMGDWGAGWWILMAFMMVVFWGLVIVGVVWLVRSLIDSARGPRRAGALEVLDHRLASGEITPEEYRERRAMLSGRRPDDGSG